MFYEHIYIYIIYRAISNEWTRPSPPPRNIPIPAETEIHRYRDNELSETLRANIRSCPLSKL